MPTNAFVPLTSRTAPAQNREFHSLVIQDPEQIKSLRTPAAVKAGGGPPISPATSCEPRVSIERDGERITRIHIECGCGQVFDLACEYTPPA